MIISQYITMTVLCLPLFLIAFQQAFQVIVMLMGGIIMKMSNKTYDILKWVALVALDAIGVFYKAFAGIWALPLGDEVLATCAALSLLLGTLLGISNANYRKTNI